MYGIIREQLIIQTNNHSFLTPKSNSYVHMIRSIWEYAYYLVVYHHNVIPSGYCRYDCSCLQFPRPYDTKRPYYLNV